MDDEWTLFDVDVYVDLSGFCIYEVTQQGAMETDLENTDFKGIRTNYRVITLRLEITFFI